MQWREPPQGYTLDVGVEMKPTKFSTALPKVRDKLAEHAVWQDLPPLVNAQQDLLPPHISGLAHKHAGSRRRLSLVSRVNRATSELEFVPSTGVQVLGQTLVCWRMYAPASLQMRTSSSVHPKAKRRSASSQLKDDNSRPADVNIRTTGFDVCSTRVAS
eukprot:1191754-Prorocentrum_minimum.AAC.3